MSVEDLLLTVGERYGPGQAGSRRACGGSRRPGGRRQAVEESLDERRVDEGVAGGDVGDRLGQRRAADLLEQVAGGAGHDRGEQGFVVVVRREDEAPGAGAAHLDLTAHVDAAAVGQARVEQRHLRSECRYAA